MKNRSHVSASPPNATIRCQSVRSCFAPLRSVNRSVVANEKFATFCPDGSARMSGLAPRLPITITLLTDMTTNLLVRLRPLPVIGQDALCFHSRANLFPRGPYTSNRRAVRRFLDARAERAAGRARAKATRRAGTACLYGVHCRCSCSLIVKEELNIFSLGLSPNLEAEEKNVVGRGAGVRLRDAKPRRSSEAGQDSFPWPTTPIAASHPMNEMG